MAVKKSELYSILWEACNKLRGGVEPSRYKDYVLVLLFFKYVSDRYKGKRFAEFKINEGASFDDLVKAKGKSDVGERVDIIIQQFLEDNRLKGLLPDVSFNNPEELGKGKELVDKVSGLIAVFENPAIDFKSNVASGDDIIGDAYEYFMMKFAQESGKSKGQFYTPSEVSRTIARLIGIGNIKQETGKRWTLHDPACKSGVFLREIAKRLLVGLEPQIPDLQDRIDHIFQNQLYGIAITELTSLLSRRSVYCSKYPNSDYSVTKFDDAEGNIRFRKIQHTWTKGKCTYCGISNSTALGDADRGENLESHAYEWIHILKPEEIFRMKFDVIISNPPYAQDTAGAGRQAKPIYNQFISQSKKLNPRFITMIIPSRWFTGGMGLNNFRNEMMNDRRISKLVDYTNSKDCFPGISVSGGVSYFLWDRDYKGDCEFKNVTNGKEDTLVRPLNEFSIIVRYNKAVSIIHKISNQNEISLDGIISSLMPYGLSTSYRGSLTKASGNLALHASDGISYISRSEISKGNDAVDSYKILISKTSAEHAGEPDKDGKFRVIPSSMKVLSPGEVCTHSYFIVGNWDNEKVANNAISYLKTKFVRFLMLQSMSGFGLSKLVFNFVPIQDFSKPWTDQELYEKYNLSDEEIEFIESMIKPMDI